MSWPTAKLGTLATKVGSGATPRGGEQAYERAGVPFVRSQNIHFDGFRSEGLAFLSASQAEALDGATVATNDVLLNITGASIGRVTTAPAVIDGARVNQHVCIIRVEPTLVEPRYLAAYLRSPRMQTFINDEQQGVTRQALTKGMILDFDVPLPSVEVQRRIVAKVDALLAQSRAAREHLEAVPDLVETYRQSVLAAAFRGDLTADWRRAAEHSHHSPDHWQATSLGACLLDVRYGTSKKCSYEPKRTPVLRIPNVAGGSVSHEDIKYASFDDAELAKLALLPGDLLMIRSNGSIGLVGRTALVTNREKGLVFAGYLIRLRPDPAVAIPEFLSLALSSSALRTVIEGAAKSTSGVNNINAEEIRSLPVSLPSIPEQRAIVTLVGRLLSRSTAVTPLVQGVDLANLERALLAKAFSGDSTNW